MSSNFTVTTPGADISITEGGVAIDERAPVEGPARTMFVEDNLGNLFVVDVDAKTRHPVGPPGSGSYAAAVKIWGQPATNIGDLPQSMQDAQRATFPGSTDIMLDQGLGFIPSDHIVEMFGGPNMMERYIAGQIRDPFVREFVSRPQDVTAGDGTTFRAEAQDTAEAPDRPSDAELEEREFEDARDYLRNLLEPYGLDTDSVVDLMDDLVVDGANESEIWFALRDTPEYEQRFAGNIQRRENGLRELAPGEYVQWEEQMRTMMQRAGLPPGFYDSPDDFDTFIGQGQGPALLADRINRGVSQLVTASPDVRQELDRLTAGRGDQGLLAFFMDPERGMESIENLFMQAQTGVTFDRAGFDINSGLSRRVSRRAQEEGLSIGQQRQQAQEAAGFVQQRRPLFQESVGERRDLRGGREGAKAGFGLDDGTAGRKIERRRKTRLATQEGGGGATGGAEGLTFGAAD